MPAVQFLRPGRPLFKDRHTVAMDPRCCCRDDPPGPCLDACNPLVLEHRLQLRVGDLVPLPGWCGNVPSFPLAAVNGQTITTRRGAITTYPYVIGADALAIASGVHDDPFLLKKFTGWTDLPLVLPPGWGEPMQTRDIPVGDLPFGTTFYGQPFVPQCPYFAFGLGTYDGDITNDHCWWTQTNVTSYYEYRFYNCNLFARSSGSSAVLYAICQGEAKAYAPSNNVGQPPNYYGTVYMVSFFTVAIWDGGPIPSCVEQPGPPRTSTCTLNVLSVLGHDRQPPEPDSSISWNC